MINKRVELHIDSLSFKSFLDMGIQVFRDNVTTLVIFLSKINARLDFQPLFGKRACAHPPNSGRNKDRTRESGGNRA